MNTQSKRWYRRIAVGMAVIGALALAPAQAQDLTDEVVRLVNQERAARGLAALVRSPQLDAAARRHSDDMAIRNFFSHTGSDGSNAGSRIAGTGYLAIAYGENIAAGFRTAQDVVTAWMNSEGHRRNILDPMFKEIGVALVIRIGSTYGYYWSQEFGTRTFGGSSLPTPSPTPVPTPTPTPRPTPALRVEVLSMTPRSGPVGTHVIIRGTRFGRAGTARFNSRLGTRVRWTDTEIEVIVPAGATTGPVTLSTPYGTTTGPVFTVPGAGETPGSTPTPTPTPIPAKPTGTPVLTKLTPDQGPAGGAVTRVTITGENLGTTQGMSSLVFLGTVKVIQWTNTQIIADLSAPTAGARRLRIRRFDGLVSNSLVFQVK
jgi:uncharacterized protein YkwD